MAKLVYDQDAVVTIQLTGTGFPEGVRAELVPAQPVVGVAFLDVTATRNSSTSVTVTAQYNKVSSEPGDTFSLVLKKGRFRYTYQNAIEIIELESDPLEIGSIKPNAIDANNTPIPSCQINGTGFDGSTSVSISGSGVTFEITSVTSSVIEGDLNAAIGAASGFRDVTVIRGAESDTLPSALEVIPIIVPIDIVSITPNTMPQGTTRTYTVAGTDFVSGCTVSISGADVTVNSVTFNSSNSLTINVTVGGSAATTQRNVTVTNPNSATDTLINGVTVQVYNPNVIDAAWLSANGPAPYSLLTTGATYVLDVDINTTGGAFIFGRPNITLDLNGHTVTYGTNDTDGATGSWGIRIFNFGLTPPGHEQAPNPAVINGSVIHGASGDQAYGLFCGFDTIVTLENVHITANGKDSHTIFARYADVRLTDSILICGQTTTFDRHQGPANIFIGTGVISNNVLIGGCSGINIAAIGGADIRNNFISHSGFATNGYGLFMASAGNNVIEDNVILPTNGRGVNSGGNGSAIRNNVILHWEEPNAEFGTALNPPAIRVRWNTIGTLYENNYSLGVGGSSIGLTSASSIYLSGYCDAATYEANVNEFIGNEAAVILVGTPSGNLYAQPLTLEAHGTSTTTGSLDVIDDNIFRSNHLMIRVGGWDGWGRQTRSCLRNEFYWTTGNDELSTFDAKVAAKMAEMTLSVAAQEIADDQIDLIRASLGAKLTGVGQQTGKAFWYLKYSNSTGTYQDTFCTLLDSVYGSGVDAETYTSNTTGTGAVTVRSGILHNAEITDGVSPIADLPLAVSTAQGDSFNATTNGIGLVDLPIINFGIAKIASSGSPFSLTARTESTVSASGYDPEVVNHASLPATLALTEI